jgi:tRNA pseudouridine38-40 synthase
MYVGTAYHGWQIQNNALTVEETLEKALEKVVGHKVKCTGAGRTDAGVHARVYLANFRTDSTIPCDRLPLAVNTRLPRDITVTGAVEVSPDFNAISGCVKKEYTYRIYNARLPNAFEVDRAWFYPYKELDERVMQAAADCFVGTHDFAAVRSVGTDVKSTVRTVYWFDIQRKDRVGCVPTAFFTIWFGPWWVPWSTPPRANSLRRRWPISWRANAAPTQGPRPLPAGYI